MTLRGDVLVKFKYILKEGTMMKSSTPPVERSQIPMCAGTRLYSSRFVF
jgi:hypothetical protein